MALVEFNPLLTLLLEGTSCNHPQARQKEHGPLATQSKGTACLTKNHFEAASCCGYDTFYTGFFWLRQTFLLDSNADKLGFRLLAVQCALVMLVKEPLVDYASNLCTS